jgi:hypothetical protein
MLATTRRDWRNILAESFIAAGTPEFVGDSAVEMERGVRRQLGLQLNSNEIVKGVRGIVNAN